MQEPTIESLSAGIQLWHISNEIYADWSRLLRAIEMWSRGGQNVLWFKIKGISIKMPMTKTRKKQTARCSPNLAGETWVLMDFQRSGGLLICLKLLFDEFTGSPSTRTWCSWSVQVVANMASDEQVERIGWLVDTCIGPCDCWWSPAAPGLLVSSMQGQFSF